MMNAVPAVRVSTMMSTRPGVYSGIRLIPPVRMPRLNRKVSPVDWSSARITVM